MESFRTPLYKVISMRIESDNIISVTEVNQNFSKVARMVEKTGEVVIFKNNKPKYRLIDVDSDIDLTEDEKIDVAAARILKRYLPAFKELAK